jgi:hypothetical protein
MIKMAGNIYFTDPSLAGQTVLVRFDAFDLSRVYIQQEGQALQPITTEHLQVRQLLRPLKHEERKTSAAARKPEDREFTRRRLEWA